MSGKVILVGAGPGDPGLLTCRGEAALRQAEVVVYDRLAAPELLHLAPETAELVDVGKEAANHKVPQWRISEILLEKAQEGKRVVRLKGGDPFLFGRGGEELELLSEHGIPFEVVPGVTSALSAPASAGIPVTHRDFASSLHIITGHAKAGSPLNINFKALAEAGGTCVFLMGVSALERICQGLLEAGMRADRPAAVVERGTTPEQRKVLSTLGRLCEEARRAELHSPAVIVVGEVVSLSEQLDWFSKRPLFGKTVVVTRPKDRAGTLSSRLRELGARVLEYPCIETVPRPLEDGLRRVFGGLKNYQWLAFTSAAGVNAFFDHLWTMGLDSRSLGGMCIAVIGPATARALAQRGLRGNYMPEVYDTPHLARGLAERTTGPVLLARAAMGSKELTRILDERGVSYTDLPVYDTLYRSGASEELKKLLAAGETLVTFTSASTVRGFVGSLGEDAPLCNVRGMCIGPQTRAEAEKYGISTETAGEATISALIELICSRSQNTI